jgi:predicted MFS family arabinose efflux permease
MPLRHALGRASRVHLVGLLLAALVFNKVEHAALGVLMQDIKHDLALSDTQLGLLSGIAFTLFYATMGIPIARWADRGNRITIISVTTALQCGALALSGMAGSFAQLLAIRVGVAVGEAGCVAPSNSLIAESFDRASRARATSWYMLGYPLSAVLGYFLGGWLNAAFGWRLTFILLGLPGLAVAAAIILTLRDPRTKVEPAPLPARPVHPATDTPAAWRLLWRNRTYRHLVAGYSLLTFFGIGVVQWLPTFFIRSHGFTTIELGIALALVWGVGGVAGAILAGEFAARRAAHDEALQIRVIAGVFAASGLLAMLIYLSPSPVLALAALVPIAAINYGTAGPLFATIQTIIPEDRRAVAVATTYLFTNLIGVGLGPLCVGLISDLITPFAGADSLRLALLALCPGYGWAAWHLWHASRSFGHDLAALPNVQGSPHPIDPEFGT